MVHCILCLVSTVLQKDLATGDNLLMSFNDMSPQSNRVQSHICNKDC